MKEENQAKYQKIINKFSKNPTNLQQQSSKILSLLASGHPSLLWEHVNYLLQQCFQTSFSETKQKWKAVLLMDALKQTIVKTFPKNRDNKMSSALIMIYAVKVQQLNEDSIEDIVIGICMSHIIQNLIQSTKVCIPEFYRFAFRSLSSLYEKDFTLKNVDDLGFSAFIVEARENAENICIYQILELLGKFIRNGNKIVNRNLHVVQKIKKLILDICSRFPEEQTFQLKEMIKEKLEFEEKKEDQFEENKIIQVRQLTPKIFDDDELAMRVKQLRKKKAKLQKKIQSDVRKNTLNKLQENQAILDARKDKIKRTQKKEQFIMQKQTEEAKKLHSKMKKVKQIQKSTKKGKK